MTHGICFIWIVLTEKKMSRFPVIHKQSYAVVCISVLYYKLFYQHVRVLQFRVILVNITSFRQSCAIALKDRITPMMVILFTTLSPPGSANKRDRSIFLGYIPEDQCLTSWSSDKHKKNTSIHLFIWPSHHMEGHTAIHDLIQIEKWEENLRGLVLCVNSMDSCCDS